MARLSELITGYAAALKVPERTVRNAAAVLRLSKLLTTGPRGPGAPHMSPTDATNLLLALMYDDSHEALGTTVPRLRDAELTGIEGRIGFDYGGGTTASTPPHRFVGHDGRLFKLGDTLDVMLDNLVRYGTLDEDVGDNEPPVSEWPLVKNIAVSVLRPGHGARIWIDALGVHWTLNYEWPDPEAAVRRVAETERGAPASNDFAHLGTYMTSERSIRDDELAALGDCLRGFALEGTVGELDDLRPANDLPPVPVA